MPLTEKELRERDAKRNIGEELLAAIVDVKARAVMAASIT
jgi:putative transcriptional regulator